MTDTEQVSRRPSNKVRAVTLTEMGSLGNIMTVNEGTHGMDMQVWYLDIVNEDKAKALPRDTILKEMAREDPEAMKKYREEVMQKRGRDHGSPKNPDNVPEWVQGVVDEERLGTEQFKLEFEYMTNNTAMAKRFVKDDSDRTEQWVFSFDEGIRMSSKIEKLDRFEDEDWTTFGTGSGTYVRDVRDLNTVKPDAEEEMPYEVTVVEDFEYEESEAYGVDESSIKEAVRGINPLLEGEDEQFSFRTEYHESCRLFRIVIDDTLYYYWFEADEIPLDFKIPDWAVYIAKDDEVF